MNGNKFQILAVRYAASKFSKSVHLLKRSRLAECAVQLSRQNAVMHQINDKIRSPFHRRQTTHECVHIVRLIYPILCSFDLNLMTLMYEPDLDILDKI